MKTAPIVSSILLWAAALLAQQPVDDGFDAERGPHHAVTRSIERQVTSYGKVYFRTNRYVTLATGMHYWADDQWQPAREEVEIVEGRAVAQHGQVKAAFAANLNSPGAIEMTAPDGKRFASHVLGLAYVDGTGQSVLFASVKDCAGVILSPNQVYYLDAFDAAPANFEADVRYTYRLSGVEQDVVLVSSPPSPADYGLDPVTARLEVWTEFPTAPPAIVQSHVLQREEDPQRRAVLFEPDLIDEHLDFGSVKVPSGYAFSLPQEDLSDIVPTAKNWIMADGRRFLVEKLDLRAIEPHLRKLQQAAAAQPVPGVRLGPPFLGRRLMARSFPPAPRGEPGVWKETQVAQAPGPSRPGLLIDYEAVLSQTGAVFRADTTHLITNYVNLYGTTVIEGGSVCKYSQRFSASHKVRFMGPVLCKTDPWHPAYFTAAADDMVGEIISGSTGNPMTNAYAYIGLQFGDTTTDYFLHDLRVRYLTYALALENNTRLTLRNAQVSHGNTVALGSANSMFHAQNILIHNITNYVFQNGPTNKVEHGTLHKIKSLVNSQTCQPALTNTLLISVSNNVWWTGQNVETNLDDTGIFASAGSGAHYLPEASPYREAGGTNVTPDLLKSLRTLTVDAPVVLSNAITATTILQPQVVPDWGAPDLGAHFNGLDFIARGLCVTNATLVLTNGVVVGIDFGATNYGILLQSGARLVSQGWADQMNRLVRIHAVQEGPAASGTDYAMLADIAGAGSPPEARFRFTDFPLLSGSFLWLDWEGDSAVKNLSFQDCQFRGGRFWWGAGAANGVAGFTNSLFERVDLALYPTAGSTNSFWNNLFWKGSTVFLTNPGEFFLYDNFFATTNLAGYGSFTNDYNGYITNLVRLWPNGAHDVLVTNSYVFLPGLLGNYYYPTNDAELGKLTNSGSRSASSAGLYHFTTLISEQKEASSAVDVGFHFLALDGSGLPLDTDGDGLPDYLEDLDGDGVYDSGETDWQDSDTDEDGVSDYLEWLIGRTATNPAVSGGSLGLTVYTPLK